MIHGFGLPGECRYRVAPRGLKGSEGVNTYIGTIDVVYMGDCQNYGPFLGPYYNTGPNTGPYLGDPKRDHNFDNPPYEAYDKRSLQGSTSRLSLNPKPALSCQRFGV